jgi:hypothetical protein
VLEIHDASAGGIYRQGSETAQFVVCKNYGVLVAALHDNSGRLYAAVSANAVNTADFGAAIDQPKRASGEE